MNDINMFRKHLKTSVEVFLKATQCSCSNVVYQTNQIIGERTLEMILNLSF